MTLWQLQLELAVRLVHEACNRFLILPQLYQQLSPAPPERYIFKHIAYTFAPKTLKPHKMTNDTEYNSVLLVIIKFNFRVQLTVNARFLETVPPHEKSGRSFKPGTLSLFRTGNFTT